MTKICYVPKVFSRQHMAIVGRANAFLRDYVSQGFTITLRQLYYRFVASALIPNEEKSYKHLGKIISDARLAGKIDWDYIEDRTRFLMSIPHFANAQHALTNAKENYFTDLWERQEYRPEVWIEKDALSGVISRVCSENDVPYFSCRGYASLSEMWGASQRFERYNREGQTPYIIHFGDHDPSGIDMSRDIFERINRTFGVQCKFIRVALNMGQIEEYGPPPNPAKVTDPRAKKYIENYGDSSWELDALDPPKFRDLIESYLGEIRDEKQWKTDVEMRERTRTKLAEVAKDWETISTSKVVIKRLGKEVEKFTSLVTKAELEKVGLEKKLEEVRRKLAKEVKGKRKS